MYQFFQSNVHYTSHQEEQQERLYDWVEGAYYLSMNVTLTRKGSYL